MKSPYSKALILAFVCLFAGMNYQFSSNPPIDRTNRTGSNCTSCHSGSINPSGGTLNLTGPSTYYPGRSYTLNLNQTGGISYGFELTSVLTSNTNTGAGTFGSASGISSRSSGARSYASSAPKNSSGVWAINWTAPNTNVGNVRFYIAGVSANGNGGNSGDKVYTQTLSITSLNLIAATVNTTKPTCAGNSNGTATVSPPTGGTGGTYIYNWGPGITNSGNMATGLSAGSYAVTIEDNSGNELIKNFTVGPGVNIQTGASINSTICGDSTGSIRLNPSGGNAPYSYLWANGDTTDSLLNLSAGNYGVTITDTLGCSKTASLQVRNSGSNLQVDIQTLPDFCSQANGLAYAYNLSGNNGPANYTWSSGVFSDSAFNLNSGVYLLTVTDSIGCVGVFSDTVLSETSLNFVEFKELSDACQAGIGSLSLDSSLGQLGSLNFNWSTGASGSIDSIGGLLSGNYSVTVTDSVGCSVSKALTVLDSQSPELSLQGVDLSCYQDSSGRATSSVSSGTPPFSYLWSNGESSDSLNNLTAGTYILTITDSFNCQSVDTIDILEPLPIVVDSIQSIDSDSILCDGSLEVFARGGTATLQYQWNDPQMTANSRAINLCPGVYQVVIEDDNLCKLLRQETLGQLPTGLSEKDLKWRIRQIGNEIQISGPSSRRFSASLYDLNSKKLMAMNIGGGRHVISTNELAAGIYLIHIETDDQGEFYKVYVH